MLALRRCRAISAVLLVSAAGAGPAGAQSGGLVSSRARQLHDRAVVVDAHAETPQRLLRDKTFEIGRRQADGGVDIPRLRDGGVDAMFFSIWVSSRVKGAPVVTRAKELIDAVREAVRAHSNDLVLATTAADIRRAAAAGKIAALMGMEGGHMINNDLRQLQEYEALGVRYLTLTHTSNTSWADSSTDRKTHNGLTAFGKSVVRELNRLGVMVDISHVSDKTFYDAIEVSRAPIIASHSSCRALSNSARNMSDDMLRALAGNGGVVMINYAVAYLSEEFRAANRRTPRSVVVARAAASRKCGDDNACAILEITRIDRQAMEKGQLPTVRWEAIVEHIDHAVKVAGIDHVGLGSDFDGAVMPLGMEDVSKLPRITEALLSKGYSEQDIAKILGGNLLRVMEQVERAKQLH
jgi:membrane dipeptidase